VNVSKGRGAVGANLNRPKEIKMSGNRLFNVFVIAALVALIALTASQAIATAKVVASASNEASCVAAAHRPSVTAAYSNESHARYTRINGIVTGLEGGLIELLSGQRICDQ
jgi:hypothetical protein